MSCNNDGDCSNHEKCNKTCQCSKNYKGEKCDQCISDAFQMKNGTCFLKCDTTECPKYHNCEVDTDSNVKICKCQITNTDPDEDCQECLKNHVVTNKDGCQPIQCVSGRETCRDSGTCELSDKSYHCVCKDTFEGEFCQNCTPGLVKSRNKCLPQVCVDSHLYECSDVGKCDIQAGICTCIHGYAGRSCQQCIPGFKPVFTLSRGVRCYPEICFVDGEENPCSRNGKCNTKGTESFCQCEINASGPQCQNCARNYEKLKTGFCMSKNCAVDGQECAKRGYCLKYAGGYRCECRDNFSTSSNCTKCISKHVEVMGVCEPQQCVENEQRCSSHGYCQTVDFFKNYKCVCEAGYSGEFCKDCASGFVSVGNGACANPECVKNSIECSNNGKCKGNQSGTWKCDCNIGSSGDTCESCERGYLRTKGSKCVIEDCFAGDQECGGNGICEDLTLEHKCVCNGNFTTESRCMDCADGYKLKDGICVEQFNLLSGGAIAGIVLAIAVVIIASGLGVWFVVKGKKAKRGVDQKNVVPKDMNFI